MDFKAKLAALGLPPDSYVIVGSGILQALGIRGAEDIDLVVTNDVFKRLRDAGWEPDETGVELRLRHDVFDAGTIWMDKRLEEVLPDALVIDGLQYIRPAELLAWKRRYGREKDQRDIELLETYLQRTRTA